MTDPTSNAAPTKPANRKSGGYLFIPRNLQKADIILWLRRTHAWTGIYGAVFFFLLGLTGFYLNHRTSTLHIDGGVTREVAAITVAVDPEQITDSDGLTAWMRDRLNATGKVSTGRRGPPGGQVQFRGGDYDQPETLTVNMRGPNATLTASYTVGANMINLKQSSPSLLKGLIDLHKVIGVGAVFILLMDTMAGAMMFMSVSGVLLWTRLHRPPASAVGLMGGVVVLTAVALSGHWISWATP